MYKLHNDLLKCVWATLGRLLEVCWRSKTKTGRFSDAFEMQIEVADDTGTLTQWDFIYTLMKIKQKLCIYGTF